MKKLKQDYKRIKDHNNQSGANRKTSKWFHRPAYSGNAGTKDLCAGLLELRTRGENGSTSEEFEETELNSILDAPAAASTPSRHSSDGCWVVFLFKLVCNPTVNIPQTDVASTSISQPCLDASTICQPTTVTILETATTLPLASTSHQQPAASIVSCSRPGKRKRTDTLLTTVQEMLVSDAELQRTSDERFNSMLEIFHAQQEAESEERAAIQEEMAGLRADLAEGDRHHRTFMEGVLSIMDRIAERLGAPQ
ncbi:uncharacterized protein LOC121638032 [Melanotaenia boesemani]|uniref:uncharacterized protein LOC121638032 n=1 Tax=Melanotaenia boesemani TaxID=1250792 RepID=UPI001C05DB07|nr:uncharacterized protein LOC121638032 [Melanotaenia boesemani]